LFPLAAFLLLAGLEATSSMTPWMLSHPVVAPEENTPEGITIYAGRFPV